ncbi:MAG: crossover junction endodeoxyribonuclease RuvC [Arachnia propionica]|nr:MAG: crossover junction endodeoxyribonuclease RuvC [Arachnia propionica]
MRVLGVDPGLTRCGVGVVEGQLGRAPQLVAVGVIRTATDLDTPLRLVRLEAELVDWLNTYQPDIVAIERVFAQHNRTSVLDTAQAAGIAALVAARAGLPVRHHTPSEVKAAISGSGRADKAQVQTMVRTVLRLSETPKPADAADALALAITQLWRGPATNRYAAIAQAHR